MEKITYGAPRLVDWVAQIKAGSATVRVHFTGGALTSYGVTPAEYTTSNPFIQKAIGQSTYFKEGRIIILRRAGTATKGAPGRTSNPKPKPQATPAPIAAESTSESSESVAVPPSTESETEKPSTNEEPPAGTDSGAEESDSGILTVEASCLQDAQAYLQENFNISSYKVRTYEAAQRAAAEHGVRFVGAKFDTLTDGAESESGSAEPGE